MNGSRNIGVGALIGFIFFQLLASSIQLDFGEFSEVLSFGKEVTIDVLEAWDLISTNEAGNQSEILPGFVKRKEKRLLNKMSLLSNKIDAFEEKAEIRSVASVDTIIRQFQRNTQLILDLRELDEKIDFISKKYDTQFRPYVEAPSGTFQEFTLVTFATESVASDYGIMSVLERIHTLIAPDHSIGRQNLLRMLVESMQEAAGSICNDQQSPQQLLYNLYNTIAVTEIKGYAMMQFSWLLLKLYKKGVFTEENQLMRTRYDTRMGDALKAVRTAMAYASQDLWTCDPPYPRDESTYTELSWFLQSYVVNEVDLNRDNTCRENCAYYNYAKMTGCFKDQYCSQQRRCNGKLYNCQYIDSDMWICPAAPKSGRRYDYIEYENGRVFGKKGVCTRGTTKVDSWWRWLFWHCSYCVCSCDDHSADSDRYFNMRQVTADIESNKVITGIRFVKVNRVIHLQIEQGELLPRGKIAKNVEWKPVENYTISDSKMKNGVDFFTMSWDDRAIDLDDLTAAPGHVLTGVGFRSLGSHLNLEIRTTQFNFTSGSLMKDRSVWHGDDSTDVRTTLDLHKPDRPTVIAVQSVPDSKSNQYVSFTQTDLDKDAGQSTVPFIDTQSVAPYPRIPIAGAGIYHKGRPGSGGYIAPKLRTYNFAPHLNVNTSLAEPVIKGKNANNEIVK